ncbi:glycosyltransferase family A protein [Bradyrhizobium sp. B117]|uniref:glycosyltransferase family 2 protein n=1 Tax=Bradyrhizobium sp. B117 TaxID=3140246 RepID=UPI003183AA17
MSSRNFVNGREAESSLVSVVIPAYNAQEFIERTLHSALAQTHLNLEVLVIDDGSTDRTLDIVQRLARADARVKIFSIPNAGVAEARNFGLRNSAGGYVAFLDADDLWHPNKIEAQLAALNAAPNAAACYVMFRTIDSSDMVTGSASAIGRSGYAFAHHLYARPVGNGSSLLVRREIALSVGGYDSSWAAQGLGGCEDYDFELKLAARYPLVFVERYLLGYRSYPGNMSSNRVRMARALIATTEHHLRINEGLPSWFVRKATGSATEFAILNFFADRLFFRTVLALSKLLRHDLIAGTQLAYALAGRICAYMFPAKPIPKSTRDERRFEEMCPDEGVTSYKPTRREQRTRERIAKLDLILAAHRGTRPQSRR